MMRNWSTLKLVKQFIDRIPNKNLIIPQRVQFSSIRTMPHSLAEVVDVLEQIAPTKYAEDWDNVGLLIEPATPRPIGKILLTNDLTEAVLQEAISTKSDMIISYHPPIFSGIKRITNENWKSRLVSVCLENRIAVYSPHTSWDNTRNSIGDWLCDALPHKPSEIIAASKLADDVGAGRVAEVDSTVPITLANAMDRVKRHVGVENVHLGIGVHQALDYEIKTFAVCPGSGSSVLRGVKADLFITGEMSHHDVLDAIHNNTSVILCNHSNSERGFLKEAGKIILSKLAELSNGPVKIVVSECDEDPLVTH